MLRAIGYEQDKDILQIFDLAEEVKVNIINVIMCVLASSRIIMNAKIRINSVLQQKNNLLLVLFHD